MKEFARKDHLRVALKTRCKVFYPREPHSLQSYEPVQPYLKTRYVLLMQLIED